MANISFANLTQDFSIWRDEIDNHATEKLPDTLFTNTASGHYVTLQGSNLKYQNGVPLSGNVESLEIKLGGAKQFADIEITNLNADFGDYANMVAAPTNIERTTTLWSATLAGDDTFDFGSNTTARKVNISFTGDGYEAPAGTAGGDDVVRGDIREGTFTGDFVMIDNDLTAYGGDDNIQLLHSAGAFVIGDVGMSYVNSHLFAGDDYIKLDRSGFVVGDVATGYGIIEAGNDTIFGGDERDDITGDVSYVASTSQVRFGDDVIHAGEGDDYVNGDYGSNALGNLYGGNDKLFGDAGDDFVYGNGGNDKLDGGTGNDFLNGGEGIDIVRGGAGNDTMNGSAGVDTVDYSDKTVSVEIVFDDSGSGPVKVNGVFEDQIDQFENIIGGSGNDRFTGYSEYNDNVFDGRAGNDTLRGGGGRDTLIGGAGKDKLIGGVAIDTFVFNAKIGSTNVDKIVDFAHGTDKIALDDAIFRALGSSFEKSEFVALKSGHAATNGSQHVIYDKAHGSLWFDADSKGGHAAVQFAQLGTAASHPTDLNWHDFAIV